MSRDRDCWWDVVASLAEELEEGTEDPAGATLASMDAAWGDRPWRELLDQAGKPTSFAPGREPRFKGPGNMNIIVDRRTSTLTDKFDDVFSLYWQDSKGGWRYFRTECTADPGFRSVDQPINAKGTAVLCDGFHSGKWQLDKHRGKYTALVQREHPVKVWRVPKGRRYYDARTTRPDTAYGINVHKAGDGYEADEKVGGWSAGCIVIPDELDYGLVIILVAASMRLYGPRVSILVE